MLDRSLPPPVQKLGAFSFKKAETTTLSNGLKLNILSSGLQPGLSVSINFRGLPYKEGGFNYSAILALDMLTKGTSKMSAKEIADKLNFYAATINASTSQDKASLNLTTIARFLPDVLPLLISVFTDANFPDQEFEREKQEMVNNLQIEEQQAPDIADQAFRQAAFNGHFYQNTATVTGAQNVTREEVFQFYKNEVLPYPFEIDLAGGLSPEDIALVSKAFSAMPIPTIHEKTIAHTNLQPAKKVIEKDGFVQASVLIAFPFVARQHPDYFSGAVLRFLLGGSGLGSRLNKRIREDLGYSYGVHCSHIDLRYVDGLEINAELVQEHVENAIEEIYGQLDVLKSELVPLAELEKVKNQLIGAYRSALDTPFMLMKLFTHNRNLGLSYANMDRRVEAVLATTPEDIMRLANQYFIRANATEILVKG